jgi:hypothetical protein
VRICDRCGGMTHAAWVVYVGTGLLYFCGHHHAQHLAFIKSRGYRSARIEDHNADSGQRLGW